MTLDIGNVGSSLVLWDKLDSKELDVLVTYMNHDPKYILEPICEERMVIAMNKNMRGAESLAPFALTREEILTKSYSPDREIEDTSIFSDIEFVEFSRKSDTGKRMLKILGNYKSTHYKIKNSRHSEMHYNLMCAGVGAVLTTTLGIAQMPYDDDILFFIPKCEDSYRKVFLAYHTSSKNNQLIKNLVRVAKEIYAAR